jgi:hypothetical protein
MARLFKKIGFAILSFTLSLWVVMAGFFPAVLSKIPASASTVVTYEQTNVMDDLKDATIGGEKFSLTKYGFNAFKDTQVLSLVEYCYSFFRNMQDNYGLYIYLYNPKGLNFDVNHVLNTIQFAYGAGTSTNYHKYPLKFLNCSADTNYERLFYKFKVVLTSEQKKEILETLNSTERIYRISGVELVQIGKTNATEFSVGTTYRYSGYAAGCGSNTEAGNTLVCDSEQAEVLTLNVHPTTYRPSGTNGKNDYTQDSLHSVYFAVPNSFIEKYGAMTAVHAIWKNAITAPIFVTGNKEVYDQVVSRLGEYTCGGNVQDEGKNNDIEYALVATKAQIGYRDSVEAAAAGYVAYNVLEDGGYYDKLLNEMYYAFYAGNGDADNYTISSGQVLDELEKSAERYGGTLVNGKYSNKMFESYDESYTELKIKAEDKFSLTSEMISQTWWEKLWGLDGSVSDRQTFDGVQAIYSVKESDINGSIAEISERLYIAESDVMDLKNFYNANKSLCTVYLFRYMQSEYRAYEVTEYRHVTDWALIGGTFNTYEVVDTNAYFAQTAVQLDFDIIDVTFSNGSVDTVIPVVASPIDIVPNITPPVYTQSDESAWIKWMKTAVRMIVVVGIVIIFAWIVKIVFKFVKRGFEREDKDKKG